MNTRKILELTLQQNREICSSWSWRMREYRATEHCSRNTYVEAHARLARLVLNHSFSLQYNTTKRWADYLVSNALQPQNQYVLCWVGMRYSRAVLTSAC